MNPSEEAFVQKFHRSIYVNDIATSLTDADAAYQFYLRAKQHLAKATFNLRRFETSSPQLHQRIAENELRSHESDTVQSSSNVSGRAVQQVLGGNWDVETDQLLFDVSDVACLMKESDHQEKRHQPCSRSEVSDCHSVRISSVRGSSQSNCFSHSF